MPALFLRPLAASALACAALAANPRPRVAGVFDHGLALDAGGPEGLVYCGNRKTGLLPSLIVLREHDVARLIAAFAPGDVMPVAATNDAKACILLDRTRTFDVPAVRAVPAEHMRPVVEVLARWLERRAEASGLGAPVATLFGTGHELGGAFAALTQDGEAGALRHWIGRGGGSTPAGDDMLLGALAWLQGAGAMHAPLAASLRRLEPEFDRLTTRTSACYLRWALRGRFAGDVVRLLAALAGRGDVARRATRLAAHGATSGIDTLAGLALAARAHLARAHPAPAG